MFIIIFSKPPFVFKDIGSGTDKEAIPFGVGEGKTILSLGVLTILVAVLTFYFVALIHKEM